MNVDTLARTLACQLSDTWNGVKSGQVNTPGNPIEKLDARVSIALVDNLNNSIGASVGFKDLKFGTNASSTLGIKREYMLGDQADASFAFDLNRNTAGEKCNGSKAVYAMTNFGLVDWAKSFDQSQGAFPDSAGVIKFVRTATFTVVDGNLGFSFGKPVSLGPSLALKSIQKTTITIEFIKPPKLAPTKLAQKSKASSPKQGRTAAVQALLDELERQKAAKILNDALKAESEF